MELSKKKLCRALTALLCTASLVILPQFTAEAAEGEDKAVNVVEVLPELKQARDELFCAWACLASYSDRIGEIARREMETYGVNVNAIKIHTKKSEVKYQLLTRPDPDGKVRRHIIVITGSESLQDAKTVIDLHRVEFTGGDAFQTVREMPTDYKLVEPKVHAGFSRYTNDAFFTPDETGKCLGDELAAMLKADPEQKLLITGHSLGGAVATILGARLLNLGVSREQIAAVTFGAPAVGNETFALYYLPALNLTRIVLATDQISGFFQAVPMGYVQAGRKKEWRRSKAADSSSHEMISYLDAALHQYYDLGAWEKEFVIKDADLPKVYIAPIQFDLEKPLSYDLAYMDEALRDAFSRQLPGAVFSNETSEPVMKALTNAELKGAKFVLVETVRGDKVADPKGDGQRLFLSESVYSLDGSLVFFQEVTTGLKHLTPLEACLFNQFSLEETRAAALKSAATNGSRAPQLRISL